MEDGFPFEMVPFAGEASYFPGGSNIRLNQQQ